MIEKYEDYYRKVGKRIKTLRTEKGWSQQELANNCDKVDRSKISDMENAKEDFMFSTLLDIEKALGKNIIKIADEK
ncbi:helix-turn-helix domain-containing protein [Albibacterium indicum]|uniref:helix-turn-helix domain-containing protein n=1 Tax=Albibacterium indicum TaxID=2292082 RepID=UPI000E4F0C80|nr:helix-turn-helix transcriptional regulator [Pedobacter indicus]